jgi:hypothetical protein
MPPSPTLRPLPCRSGGARARRGPAATGGWSSRTVTRRRRRTASARRRAPHHQRLPRPGAVPSPGPASPRGTPPLGASTRRTNSPRALVTAARLSTGSRASSRRTDHGAPQRRRAAEAVAAARYLEREARGALMGCATVAAIHAPPTDIPIPLSAILTASEQSPRCDSVPRATTITLAKCWATLSVA